MSAKICRDLQEVRDEIDRIDSGMIRLPDERGEYVRQAAAFKKKYERCESARQSGAGDRKSQAEG